MKSIEFELTLEYGKLHTRDMPVEVYGKVCCLKSFFAASKA